MEFNHSKCQVMRVTPQGQCILYAQVLEAVSSVRYFEVDISSHLSWKSHVDRFTAKANRSLRFMNSVPSNSRNGLSIPSSFPTRVRFWDLYTKDRTYKVEMVQRRAAWWTLSDYTRTNSVTSLHSQLNWQTLEGRRSVARLCLFYKFVMAWWLCSFQTYVAHT